MTHNPIEIHVWRPRPAGNCVAPLESSLKLAPGEMSARLLLGHVYLQLRDAENAEDQFEAALLVDSNNIDGRLGLVEA